MHKFFKLLAIAGLIVILCSCKEDVSSAKFVITDDKVLSWKDQGDAVYVVLNKQSEQALFDFSKSQQGKVINIYIEDTLIASPLIREPVGKGGMMFTGKEMHELAVPLLPSDKKSEQ